MTYSRQKRGNSQKPNQKHGNHEYRNEFIGGIPLCLGAGGLSAQYLFGARTGGAIFMEGIIEISLGLFFSQSLLNIFSAFPLFVVGVMLHMTSFELGKIFLNQR